jgi:hypothetical protein
VVVSGDVTMDRRRMRVARLGRQFSTSRTGNVRGIPAKLATIDRVMVTCRPGLPAYAFTEAEVETLARQEHERWMQALGPGWGDGKATDKARKVHEANWPCDELPNGQKEKDRDLVREIPRILHEAGYVVARTGVPQPGGV